MPELPVNTTAVTGHAAPCICNDREADLLRDLISSGLDQRTASHLLWGDRLHGARLLIEGGTA